jgi:hypothetical protein
VNTTALLLAAGVVEVVVLHECCCRRLERNLKVVMPALRPWLPRAEDGSAPPSPR